MILGTGSLLPPLPPGEAAGDEGGGEGGRPDREPTIDDVRAVLEEQLFDHSLITPEVVETRWRMRGRRASGAQRDRAQADRAAERRVPPWERLGDVPVPLMMMYGANDRPSTARQVTLLRERYPSLDVRLLDRCRHIIQWDAASEFEAAAGAFFTA